MNVLIMLCGCTEEIWAWPGWLEPLCLLDNAKGHPCLCKAPLGVWRDVCVVRGPSLSTAKVRV